MEWPLQHFPFFTCSLHFGASHFPQQWHPVPSTIHHSFVLYPFMFIVHLIFPSPFLSRTSIGSHNAFDFSGATSQLKHGSRSSTLKHTCTTSMSSLPLQHVRVHFSTWNIKEFSIFSFLPHTCHQLHFFSWPSLLKFNLNVTRLPRFGSARSFVLRC